MCRDPTGQSQRREWRVISEWERSGGGEWRANRGAVDGNIDGWSRMALGVFYDLFDACNGGLKIVYMREKD